MHADRKTRLLTTLQSEIDKGRLPGAVVILSRHGKVELFERLGDQNLRQTVMVCRWPKIPFSVFIP